MKKAAIILVVTMMVVTITLSINQVGATSSSQLTQNEISNIQGGDLSWECGLSVGLALGCAYTGNVWGFFWSANAAMVYCG
jgi:hypothetical protein